MAEHAHATDSRETGKPELLLVDDDPLIVDSLSMILEEDYRIYSAESRKQVKELIRKIGFIPPVALVDLGLPPLPHHPTEGFELISELAGQRYDIKILVLSGQSEKKNIQHALTLGAVDFISKPCDIPLLKTRLSHQFMMLEAERINGTGQGRGQGLMGESQEIRTLHALTQQFADTPFPVLIEGESGSGKELVARYLHEQSSREQAPFLTVNCAAFSPELLEAQLFGHEKGAYTGATTSRAGFFEDAGDGTLFLDEIGDMPLGLQSKLLRVLENGEFYRLGETQPRTSRARIVAATNRGLKGEVAAGRFRQDLYHRLSVLTIQVPPLRDRGRDCLLLLDHFRGVYAMGKAQFTLDEDAEQCLLGYPFPGNVRELRNIVIRLSHKYPGRTINAAQLREELDSAAYIATGGENLMGHDIERELDEESFSLDEVLKEWERSYILAALKKSEGNLSKAARLLGINRTTLYSRTQRLDIDING